MQELIRRAKELLADGTVAVCWLEGRRHAVESGTGFL